MGSPPRVHKLVHLLTLASTVSALSLANFQIIISNAIPSTCIRAYSHPIHGCFVRDFTGGSLCSSKCTNGLLKAEAKIDAACKGVDVNRDTLLGVALRGDLIATLCPGVIVAPSTTVTVTVPARTTTQSSTTTTPLPPAQTSTQTTLSTLSTSTTAAGTKTTTTTSPRSTSVPQTTSTSTSTSTPSSVETTTTAPPPPPPPSATPTDANTPLPQTTATEPSRPNGGGRPPLIGGGGSPFDQPVIGSGRSRYTVCWTEAIWAALGATVIVLC